MSKLPLVPVIVGPTAVGKTAVVEELARLWNILVVSADSRQIYRRLNIGTAKPDAATLARVPHVGLDMVDPGERFSAGRFARAVQTWCENEDTHRRTVVVGGTGFYIKAITDGLFEEPEVDVGRRERLRTWMRHNTDPGRWAARLDPRLANKGKRLALRAVEVALLTGYPLSWWHENSPGGPVIRPWFVRLTLPRAILHARIQARTDDMLARGWIDEVRELLSSGVEPLARGLDAVGYREIVRYLQGQLSADELPGLIARGTRRYAKRQVTWFTHQLRNHPVLSFDATESAPTVARQIAEAWNKRND